MPFALGKLRAMFVRTGTGHLGSLQRPPKQILSKQSFSLHDFADSLNQQRRRPVFHEDPRDSFSDQAWDFYIVHVGGHEQYLSVEARVSKAIQQVRSRLLSEIDVQ